IAGCEIDRRKQDSRQEVATEPDKYVLHGELHPSSRTDPVAVKTIGHAMAEMHQRDGTGGYVGRVEDSKLADVLGRAPHGREQPAVAFRGVLGSLDEHGLGDAVAEGEEIFREPLALAVDMRDAGKALEHRKLRIGAGVPAVLAGKAGATIVDARKLSGEVVEIRLLEAVGVAGEVEGPASEPRTRLVRIGARAVGMREQRRLLEL